MAKYNIDDILSDLGMGDESPRRGGAVKKHRIDKAESSFSQLPAVPANQPRETDARPGAADPAVPVAPAQAAPVTVGNALSDLYQPDPSLEDAPRELGELLLGQGAITAESLANAQSIIKQSPGRRLADVLVEMGADEAAVQHGVAVVERVPFERIDLEKGLEGGFDGRLLQRLTPEFCVQHLVIPLRTEGNRPVVGVIRHDNVALLDEIKGRLGVAGCKIVLVTAFDVRGALELLGEKAEADVDISQLVGDEEENDVQVDRTKSEDVDLNDSSASSPIIKIVNKIIQLAVKEGASDIHIEPGEKKLKVRYRIDGELYELLNPPAKFANAITSRLKIMANLDISERRIPQDGRIRCVIAGRKLDLRMSTLPSAVGEKTVMRILDQRSISVELEQLGFDPDILQIWKAQIDSPHGIVLVTGPTGSGKTTTLYASMRQLDKNSMNISTVEDPIEYALEGITQTQTHERIKMTFAVALKALLRQDPDVIMVGEIRDHETAHIAIQAALTGHLVLSTLHTNDAPSSVTRLVNIGMEPFLVGAALNAVLAQRLIRRLCSHCKAQGAPGEEMREFLNLQ
ncbi:MAG: ATPase, T2SS/T4P/T4SS family, partial [Planctomycetota bacterium]